MFIENPPTDWPRARTPQSPLQAVDCPASKERPEKQPAARQPGIVSDRLITDLESRFADSPESLLRWAIKRFKARLAVVTALQAGGIVLLDMARRIDPGVRAITIDTGRLPGETFELIDTVRRRMGIAIEVVHPDGAALNRLVSRAGPNLFYDSVADRLACCRIRKVEALEGALGGLDAWVTGLRRDQSPTRRETPMIARDTRNAGRLKLAPLAGWTEADVWTYIRQRGLPHHPLYDQGYRSIGCAPCTRPVQIGEEARAGRWWWEDETKKECGLHLPKALRAEHEASSTTAGEVL